MPRPTLVVFDLVGTTVRADDAVPRAFLAALAAEGVTLDAAALVEMRGATKRLALDRLLPPGPDHAAAVERAYARFTRSLREAYRPDTVAPVQGAADVVTGLRRAGVRVALNTGFDRALTDHLLDVLGWTALADVVVSGDEVAAGRPAPDLVRRAMALLGVTDPATVANVGDTTLDLAAGAAAGVGWNIGVWSGAHDRARLLTAPHTHLCASVAEVPAILRVG
jgi:phosphonatase-like hydrolase